MTSAEETRVLIEKRLDRYDHYRDEVNHPVHGMARMGFTMEEIKQAEMEIDTMQDFYEDLLEDL